MNQSWDSYGKAAEKGPITFIIKCVIGLFIIAMAIGALAYVGGWFKEAGVVAQKEFGPSAMLQKYSWFKDAAAQLEKKRADIEIFEACITNKDKRYKDIPPNKWPRVEIEAYDQWCKETAGMKASYNQLASEYNAQMAKFNWSFAQVGKQPDGSMNPLPREFKPYVNQ